MENCMESHPNLIDAVDIRWFGNPLNEHHNLIVTPDFRSQVNQRYDYSGPYAVDRWAVVPEIIRRWREWKQMRDEWVEFLRTSELPYRRVLTKEEDITNG